MSAKKMHPKAEMLLEMAAALGWTRSRTSHGTGTPKVTVISPTHSEVHVLIPTDVTGWNEAKTRTLANKLIRYADPLKLASASAHSEMFQNASRTILGNTLGAATEFGRSPEEKSITTQVMERALDRATKELNVAEKEAAAQLARDNTSAVVVGVGKLTPEQEAMLERINAVEEDKPERRIVSSGPWFAKRNGIPNSRGKVYESEAVIERHWSDGTKDYACSWPGCEYEGPTGQGVTMHYVKREDHPKMSKPTPADLHVTEHYEASEQTRAYHGRETNRQKRLANEIYRALMAISDELTNCDGDRMILAEALANVLIADRDATVAREASEPPTPEQILDKIRQLVDDGSWMRMREQERLDKERIADLEGQVVVAMAEAEAASSKWTALQELVRES